jgi:pimeloyl-ACP methyl ester carboxylesterase
MKGKSKVKSQKAKVKSVSALALLLLSTSAFGAPCTTATIDCTEWLTFAGGPSRSLLYRTYPLEGRHENITRALIVIHGAGRDANNYFRTAVAAAFLDGALEDTIVISPRFASSDGRACQDKLDKDEVSWSCSGDSWRSGGFAANNQRLSSYDFTDEILRKLGRRDAFPKLKSIVVSGHSAGGQYVTRYEMATQVHDKIGIPITYVVSNPSSYAYLDSNRPSSGAYASTAAAPGYNPAAPAGATAFRDFSDSRNCTTFDQWPYGLRNRSGYAARIPDDQLKKQLASRPTIYLLGELDILPLGGFDSSCSAMAQGPTRLARGQAFAKYLNEKFGAKHTLTVVPLCGHNARCMFTAEVALPILFPSEPRP